MITCCYNTNLSGYARASLIDNNQFYIEQLALSNWCLIIINLWHNSILHSNWSALITITMFKFWRKGNYNLKLWYLNKENIIVGLLRPWFGSVCYFPVICVQINHKILTHKYTFQIFGFIHICTMYMQKRWTASLICNPKMQNTDLITVITLKSVS